jgi:hypothetical protein
MKTIDTKALKAMSRRVLFVGSEDDGKSLTHEPTGTILHPQACAHNDKANPGDIIVAYHTKNEMARQYLRAINALDLDEDLYEQFGDFDRIDTNREALKRRLAKTKLWHYAPEQRKAVKEARHFLSTLMVSDIPYGETLIVSREEMESFLEDETHRLGVSEYAYCQEETTPIHFGQAKEVLGHIGQSLEHPIETLVANPLHAMHHFVENVIEKIPSPVDNDLCLSA